MAPALLALIGFLWVLLILALRRAEGRRAGGPPPRLAWADVAAGGALFLLTLGFFWRTISGDVYQPADGGDLVSFLYPTWRFAAQEIAAGRLPLWNPHLYSGMPFVSDIQAGFLYPPHLLMFLARPDFPYRWLQLSSILHLYWAGLGLYVLLRTLRLPGSDGAARQIHPLAALVGALAFAFGDPLLIHLGNLNLIAVLAWLPWTLAAFHRALVQRSVGWAAVAGLLFALGILAGHAQSMLYISLAIGIYALLWAIFSTPTPRVSRLHHWGVSLGLVALTGLVAALLAAPVLFPALAHTQYTDRAAFSYQDTVGFSLAPPQLIGLLTPGFFGRGPQLHWGLWQRVETPYVGVAALLMAIAALLLSRGAERRALWPWAGLALAGLLLGLGIYAIVHGWLTALVPLMGQLRAPARALILWTLGVSVLAGVGADSIARLALTRLTPGALALRTLLRTGTLLLIGVMLPLIFVAMLVTQESETAFLRTSVAAIALTLAALFWLATWLLVEGRGLSTEVTKNNESPSSRLAGPLFLALLVALLFLDLSATGAYTDISPDDPTRGFRHPEIVDFLRSAESEADGPFRIDSLTDIRGLWQPDAAALHGLDDVGGIENPLMLSSWQQAWQEAWGRDTTRYQLFNVRYVVARDGTPLPDNFTLAFDAPGELALFENNAHFPRAFLAREEEGLQTPDPEQPIVTWVARTSGRIELNAAPTEPSLLVLSEVDYPGWQATINGEAAVIEVVNDFQRGVMLPAGQATVVMTFSPPPLRWGWFALALGLLLLIVLLVFDRKQFWKSDLQEFAT